MGTRADFYVGRGKDAQWLGSIGWDGFPKGIAPEILQQRTADGFAGEVAGFLAKRNDATFPEEGWPWPWDDSRTTDFAYAFDDGQVYISCFGCPWSTDPKDFDNNAPEGEKVEFPDMTAIQNVKLGCPASGIIILLGKREEEDQ